MSMEICVLSNSRLNSIAEWQHAIDNEGFPLRLSGDDPFDTRGGSLAAQLRDKPTSFEYRIEDFNELRDFYKKINFGHDWKYVLALPWISGFDGLAAAWMAATAYARATTGVVFDPQEGKLFRPEEALQIVRDIERPSPELDAALRNFMQRLPAKS